MTAPVKLIVNGKFLSGGMTGVHRVATELTMALNRLITSSPDWQGKAELVVFVPAAAEEQAARSGLLYKVIRPFNSVAWEQITLPIAAGGRRLLNFCNVGPIVHRNSVTMFHDAQVWLSPSSYSPAFRLWYRLHQPLAGRRHRLILTVSEYSRSQIAKFGIARPERIHVIHNGVDHALRIETNPSVAERLGLETRRYVLALANTQAHKNVGVVLRAFARPELSHLKLVLVGGGTPADFMAAGISVPDNAAFTGWVSDEELRGLMESGLALCFPSLTEGFGLPPLEAMLSGCPAIVSPRGALSEVCADGAIYADPEDPDSWVRAIRQLEASESAYEAAVAAGRSRARQFTWDRAAESLLPMLLMTDPEPSTLLVASADSGR